MKPDQRLSPRKLFRAHGLVVPDGMTPVKFNAIDLAPGGICIGISMPLKSGQRCALNFDVVMNGKYQKVTVVAKVTYSVCGGSDGFKVGFQFVDINETGAAAIASFMQN